MATLAKQVEALVAARPPAPRPWLAALNERGAHHFAAGGLPHTRLEDWKYTSLADLPAPLRAAGAADAARLDAAAVADLPLAADTALRVVLVNGVVRADLSSLDALPTGLAVRPLATLAEAPALLDGPAAAVPLSALNAALLADGLLVEVAADADPGLPLHIVVVADDADGALLTSPRIAIRVGPHGRLRVIEEYLGHAASGGVVNTLCEVVLDAGAQLHHHRLQGQPAASHHLGRIDVEVGRDAGYHSDVVSFGAALGRLDLDVVLAGGGARCVLNGLFVADGSQHVDHHTRVEHRVGDTHSEETYRGILDGASRGVFNGKVIVARDAQHITARQASHNLLLSREAEIDTKPELEIYADDVSCAHGATVGELDAAALFYLRSRGIPAAAARALLTYAFARAAIEHVPLDSLRGLVERRFLGHTDYGEFLESLHRP